MNLMDELNRLALENEGDHYGDVLRTAHGRIEELERLCAAKDALIDHLQSRGTFVAHTPPVEHHTRGSVLDYYRTIPKD